jgi:hypothetical protein
MPRFREAACYAEYVSSPSRHLARTRAGQTSRRPRHLAGLTAWQALVDTCAWAKGHACSCSARPAGSGLAVQIAKARGAWVAGTSSIEKHDFLRGLGVDEPLDKNGELEVGWTPCSMRSAARPGSRRCRRCATGRSSRSPRRAVRRSRAAGRVRVAGSSSSGQTGLEDLAASD